MITDRGKEILQRISSKTMLGKVCQDSDHTDQ